MSTEFYQSEDNAKEYIRMAEGFDGAELIEKLKKELPLGSTLLEIGSGPGTDFLLLQKDYQVTGSDYSEAFIKHLKKEIPEGAFYQLDAVTLDIQTHYDALYSNKVLQHLTDEELKQSAERQARILNDGGIISHSFWKGEGEEEFKGMLVNYQNPDSLQQIFGKWFEIILLEEYKEFEDNDSLLLIARKRS